MSHACRTALQAATTLRTKGAFNHQRGCAFTRVCKTFATEDTNPGTMSEVLKGPKTASAVVVMTPTKWPYASGVAAGGMECRLLQLSAKASPCH